MCWVSLELATLQLLAEVLLDWRSVGLQPVHAGIKLARLLRGVVELS
jgi:hypothetical protein